MIKEYALEKIEENKTIKPVYVDWANEKTGTDRYIAMFLCRSLSLRHKRDVLILTKIYNAYGLDFGFTVQAEKAERYFNEHNTACDLDYVTIKTLKSLADKVEIKGLELFIDALPQIVKP